jgi:hypothetical protein
LLGAVSMPVFTSGSLDISLVFVLEI